MIFKDRMLERIETKLKWNKYLTQATIFSAAMFQFSNNSRQCIFNNVSVLLIKIFKLPVSIKEVLNNIFS